MTATMPDRDMVTGLLAALPPDQLGALTDAQLAALADWDSVACVAALEREATRRQAMAARIADLRAQLAAPVTVRDVRATAAWSPARMSSRDVAEDDFDAYAEAAYLAAEAATCGHMLSAAGRAAGVDPRDLFRGPEPTARRYASWELGEWWDQHGRLTVTAFRAGLSGQRAALEDSQSRVTA